MLELLVYPRICHWPPDQSAPIEQEHEGGTRNMNQTCGTILGCSSISLWIEAAELRQKTKL